MIKNTVLMLAVSIIGITACSSQRNVETSPNVSVGAAKSGAGEKVETKTENTKSETPKPVQEVKLTEKKVERNNKEKKYSVTSKYPEISGVDEAAAKGFNAISKNIATKSADEFEKNAADEDPRGETELEREIGADLSYEVEYSSSELVSILFDEMVDFGGAHPANHNLSLNYDLKNNRELRLSDVFQPGSDYLKVISEYCKKELTEKGDSVGEWIEKGTSASEENYKVWNATTKGFKITFPVYQVAPYVSGPQTVVIPYTNLRAVLRKDSVVAVLAK